MPASLETVYERVPREKLDTYRQAALDHTLQQVKEYLGEA